MSVRCSTRILEVASLREVDSWQKVYHSCPTIGWHFRAGWSVPCTPLAFPSTNRILFHRILVLISPLSELTRLQTPVFIINPVFSIRHFSDVTLCFAHLKHLIPQPLSFQEFC